MDLASILGKFKTPQYYEFLFFALQYTKDAMAGSGKIMLYKSKKYLKIEVIR